MRRTLLTIISAGGTALAICVGSVAVAAPDASATVAPTAVVTASHPRASRVSAWLHAHRLEISRAVVEKSAAVIGITPQALVASLRQGQSIAQVAQAHNVSMATLTDSLQAAGNARISARVSSGKITVARGARLQLRLNRALQRIETHHFR